MEHGLSRLWSRIEDNAVTGPVDPVRFGHCVSLGNDLSEQAIIGTGQRGQVAVVVLRDDQHMRGRLRVDVAEGEGAGGLGHAH